MNDRNRHCQVPGCTRVADGFICRGEIYVGLPQRPGQVGLCVVHLTQVNESGPDSLKRPA
jgi:hypothetical protein